jgi:VWFA-related protein
MSRERTAVGLAPLLLLSVALPAQERPRVPSPSPSPQAAPTFPAQVEQVIVDLVVTDRKGGPVTGLSRSDFRVFEDGEPQQIASFEAIELPPAPQATPAARPRISTNTDEQFRSGRTFVVVFDDIHLTPFHAHRAKGAVAQFLQSGVREGDLVTLVATGGGAWWSARMEAGREELMTLLKRLDGRHIPDTSPERISDYEAMRIHVFHDTQVEARVSRRFETYGVNPAGRDRQSEIGAAAEGDPMVRGRASDVYFQAVSRNRITLEMIERVLNSLKEAKGRKSMILVSEGFIYDTNLDEFKRVREASRRSNVAIYFLDTRGLGGLPLSSTAQFGPAIDTQDIGATFMESLEASEGSESIASDSGGFSVKNTNDLGKGIERIAEESRAYYLLGYNPTNTRRDGRFRKIEVKTNRKGLQVRARKGYFAPLEGQTALVRKPGGPDPSFQAALDSPYESPDIPMRMTAYVFEETLLGKANVLVATDIDLRAFGFEEQDGRLVDTAEFLLVVAHRETGEYFRYDQKVDMKLLPQTRERLSRTWFPVVRDFELAAGGYQAKIVVRDKNRGVIGTVMHDFEVPDLSQLRTSSLVLTDTLQPAAEDGEKHPRPALLARRNFPNKGMLYCQFEVYGAAKEKRGGMPRVSAGYVIRRADGTRTHARIDPSVIQPTSLGKLSRMVGTPLDGASPGDYEFVLRVTDEVAGKTLEIREPFTVEAADETAGGPPAAAPPVP